MVFHEHMKSNFCKEYRSEMKFCILISINPKLSMKPCLCILFLFCLVCNSTLKAQEVAYIDTQYPVHDLQKSLVIVEENDKNYLPRNILRDSTLEFSTAKEISNTLEVGKVYWGKLKIKTNDSLTGWTLQFEDKIIGPPAWAKSNGKVDVYAYHNESLIFHKKTGVEYPSAQRDIQSNWVLNQISLDKIPPNKVITLLIRAEGNSLGYPAYFNLSARNSTSRYYHQPYQFNDSFNIFMFGVTFIILLYHILQYLYLREKVFLWFSVWLLFCTLTHAMTIGMIIGSITVFRFPLWTFIANGIFYSFWFFGRAFIGSKQKYPLFDKFIIGLPVILILEITGMLLYYFVLDVQVYFTNISFHYIFLNIYTICSLILSVILVFKKDIFARYFGIGSIIASLFLMFGTFWSLGFLPRLPKFIDPFATGIFLQIIIYSFGIALRQQILIKKSQKQKLAAQLAYAEIERIKDLDKLKTRFFSNISHEFRTPLSLIKGPLNHAGKNKNEENNEYALSEKAYQMINRNTDRLQNLIDQLLDLSKIENGKVHLSLRQGPIIGFIRSIVFSFESMAERNNVALNTSFPVELTIAYFDQDKLEKILTNILSNAFKFTPTNGSVSVSIMANDEWLFIEISDTGTGINPEDLKNIFDRFYQAEGNEEKGSGIGLALTKELVELHGGQISVDSTKGLGTTFKIRIPHTLNRLPKDISILAPDTVTPSVSSDFQSNQTRRDTTIITKTLDRNKNAPIVLIVEDNEDLRNFIAEILNNKYQILMAVDGLQGERMAFEHIPDLIISDIMMPKKDGYELCQLLKSNLKTSHIPLIMLTAKADESYKIEGLTQGADAYLTKPFNEKELQLRIRNLIEARKKMWDHFKNLNMLLVEDTPVTSIDDKFLQSVFKTIKENLDNEHYTVEDIARNVGFSRAQLHRKLKALTNKSAGQLIKEIRMNEAHRLLKLKTGTVSEIAYTVGYSNLSYFTKSFKQTFGVLPSKVG
ncbi:MAG: hypothetical protein CMC70_05465 [Flavobacteriaceae bacterium]|nr:hypothetical protein [Flavobacteriaceae bacterium]